MSRLEFLKKIDAFSKENTFKFRGDEKYSTNGGALVTIFIYLVTIASFGYMMSGLYSRNDPQVTLK